MFGNIFNQASTMPTANTMGVMGAFPQNNGISFNTVAPAKTSSSTAEEMAIIKANKKSEFTVTPEELARFGWDLREGQTLAIEIVDPATERVRIKYTGDEFNIVMAPVEVLNEYLNGLNNFVKTTALMDTTDNDATLKELLTAFGIVNKLLPIAYANGQKNYSTICNQMNQMMQANGYQGNWGGQQMFNGAMGAVPNYIINESSNLMNGMGVQQNNMQLMLQQAAALGAQQAQQQLLQQAQQGTNTFNFAGMGNPMPTAGTMMGTGVVNNPFTMGGVPQATPTTVQQPQATPTMTSIPNIPMPGTLNTTVPTQNTPNPSIGATTNTVTI